MKKLAVPDALICLLALGVFAGVFISAGCGKSRESVSTEDEKKTSIVLWDYFSGYDGTVFQEFLDSFNLENERIAVEYETIPREELLKQYTIGAVGGNLPDIGMVDNPDQSAFIEMGIFKDITELVDTWGKKDLYFSGPMSSAMRNGQIYGLPHNSNCLALWYDADILAEAGVAPPSTWEELEIVSAAVAAPGRYPLAISAVKNEEGTFQYLPWLLSAGGNIEQLDSPESIAALSYLSGFIEKGYMSPEVINWGQGDVSKQFSTGQAVMMVNGPWEIAKVKNDAPDKNWSAVKIPKLEKYASVLGGENFGIIDSIDDEKIDEAWEVLKYISYETSEEFNKAVGKFSPRSDVMATSSFWISDPILAVFAEQMEYAMPRGPHPKWPEISAAISQSLHEVFTGSKTAEQSASDAAMTVNAALNP